jgi:rhodanese-related sulfurtransferase
MKEATASECKQLVSKGHQYLDVRTPEEFQSGHAEGAKNVPVMFSKDGGMSPNPDFVSTVQKEFPDKGTKLVVGCKAGKRSAMAIGKMQEVGYTELTNIEGGYMAWCS